LRPVAIDVQAARQYAARLYTRYSKEEIQEALSAGAYEHFKTEYWDKPGQFVQDCFTWTEGQGPAFYQIEILDELWEHKRECVRGPHTIGKTTLAAWAILWFALTRDGKDWKVVTTASAWRQLIRYLWPEVHKWVRKLDWDKIGRKPFKENDELLTRSIKLDTGTAFPVASDKGDLIEGAHADHILYIYDEAKVIPDGTWDSVEGAFAGSGGDGGTEALAVAISTPGEPQGRFHDIQARKPGYADWHARHVTKEQAIASGRMSKKWAENRALQWGERSAVYQNRVLGEFASSDTDGVIPLSWIERANERWEAWQETGGKGAFTCLGADVGGGGEGSDKSVLALAYDEIRIGALRKYVKADPDTATMELAGHIKGILDAHGGDAYIDIIGIGTGLVHRLHEQGYENAHAFNAAEGTKHKDRLGELGFVDKRSAMWWIGREMLDPSSGMDVALPPDDDLTGELTAPHWKVQSGARIRVESKKDLRKRLKRSTDCADAVLQALAGPTLCGGTEPDVENLAQIMDRLRQERAQARRPKPAAGKGKAKAKGKPPSKYVKLKFVGGGRGVLSIQIGRRIEFVTTGWEKTVTRADAKALQAQYKGQFKIVE